MNHDGWQTRSCRVGRVGGWVLSLTLVIGCADKDDNGGGGGGGDGDAGGGGGTTDTFDYAGCEAALAVMRDCYLENTPDLTEEQLEVFYLGQSACEDEESRFRSTWSTTEQFACIVDAYDGLDCTDVYNLGASEDCY